MSEKYNGWSNYATWRVNLEYADDTCQNLQADESRFDTVGELAEYLDNEADELLAIGTDGTDSFAVDMARSFLSDVNWYEIAEHWRDELTRENWTECAECGEKFPPDGTRGESLCAICEGE